MTLEIKEFEQIRGIDVFYIEHEEIYFPCRKRGTDYAGENSCGSIGRR